MSNKKRVLVVDDNSSNVEILVELLSECYDVYAALDANTAYEIVNEENPDLILLDIVMPDVNGYEICENLKKDETTQDIPVIFITAKTDEESIEKAYDVGGLDYVTKPFKPKELLARVKTQLKLRTLINNLEFMSSHDTMTGVLNRRKFFELANSKFANKQLREDLFVCMIDIDNFKNINDTYGHNAGDEVIKKVAQTIDKNKCKNSIFARVGGEEFVILSDYDSKLEVTNNIEDVRKSIESLNILYDNKFIDITISCGISFYDNSYKTLDDFLNSADKLLYQAKRDGRNKTAFRD